MKTKFRRDGRPYHTKFDRELEALRFCIEHINRVFDGAIRDQTTHGWIIAQLGEHVYSSPLYRRLTTPGREYVRGYVDARMDRIWREHIAWGYMSCGTFYATFAEVPAKYHYEIVQDKYNNGFHYWKTSNGTKPFTEVQTVVTTL